MKKQIMLSVAMLFSIIPLTSCRSENAAENKKEMSQQQTAAGCTKSCGTPTTLDAFKKDGISGQDAFNNAISTHDKVVVDFYADWCGPCKQFAKSLPGLAKKHSDVLFLKINIDKENEIAKKYGIMSIPTLMYFKNGTSVLKKAGAPSAQDVSTLIEQKLS